jgi:hypothetical protein
MSSNLISTHRHKPSRLGQFAAGLSSADRLRRQMAISGTTLAGQRLWIDAEIRLLRRFYPDYERACAALPGRSLSAVKSKAFRMGITRPLRIWSDEDLKHLKGPYRQGMPVHEIRAFLPSKTAKQIWRRAAHSGWHRPRKPPKVTGLKPDDDVKARAFAYQLTVRDLAYFSDTGGYFLRRPSRTNWKKISKAVAVLEGSLSIVWNS